VPVTVSWLQSVRPSLVGGVRGRFIEINPGQADDIPSAEIVHPDPVAFDMNQSRGFAEFSEGVRLRPSFFNGGLLLNYSIAASQFVSSEEAAATFNRWSFDLRHEIPLYGKTSSTGPKEFNGPNECSQTVAGGACPPVSWSRNRSGTINLRLFVSTSSASSGDRVPFFLQPALGGSDINSNRLLASYADYRFRGPHMIALQENFEHSIWGPFGVFAEFEQGKVASSSRDLDFTDLRSTATLGVTIRAGGFPLINLSFSWGKEGHHITGVMSSTLFGGSSRTPLF